MTEPRIVRDYSKLLALIKAVTVLRHAHRQRDADGRLIAESADYATVRELVNPMFEATATRASERLRETVEAVSALRHSQCPGQQAPPVTATAVARHLGIARSSAQARIRRALDEGWLKNVAAADWRNGTAFDLRLGDVLPPRTG